MQSHSNTPATIELEYNYPQILQWLERKGKESFGDKFTILEEDHQLILQLLCYFLRDKQTAQTHNIDLSKGILLSGPVGSGKTTLMTLMKMLAPANSKFFVKPCREISFEFIQDGYQVIHRYSKGELYRSEPRRICFDDLGIEKNLKYFGNECNVMAEILLSRYDIFTSKKIQTHITTNLSATEIEAAYGNRVRSRMRELFNLIAFNSNCPDKRI